MASRYFRLTRFGRLIIVLWATLTLLTMIPIAVGRARNEPNELERLGFGVCEGRPCFMGIVPGVTSSDEAEAFAKKRGGEVSGKYIIADSGEIGVAIHKTQDVMWVGMVQISAVRPMTLSSAADFIQLYGVPCAVGIAYDDKQIALRYPSMSVVVNSDQGIFTADMAIDRIILFIHPRDHMCIHGRQESYSVSPWLGFASWYRYRTY
jgi:hypothetical protein